MEKNRQFVIFGNFAKLTFEDLSVLSDLKNKYNLLMDARLDAQMMPIGQIPQYNIPIRPIFKSIDNKILVMFGTSRIFIQQDDDSIYSFDEFVEMSLSIIEHIFKSFEISVNRIAINGSFIINDTNKISDLFKSTFKENRFNQRESDEWYVRINNVEFNHTLNTEINKIFVLNKCNTIDGFPKDFLALSYDYNTQINNTNLFDFKAIKMFVDIAKVFREYIKNIV